MIMRLTSYLRWAVFIAWTVACIAVAATIDLFKRDGAAYRRAAHPWGKVSMMIFGAKPKAEGLENVPADQHVVFMGNHLSYVDIFLVFTVLGKHDILFVAKRELFQIPVFGFALKRGGFIDVERAEPREAVKMLKHAVERIKNGHSLVVFPEGTRSSDGRLLPFKRGGFTLAAKTGLPVAPFIIEGTNDVMPKGSFTIKGGQTVTIRFLPVIKTDGIKDRELMETVRAKLLEYREDSVAAGAGE